MNPSHIKITDEIYMNDNKFYVIRIDGEETFVIDNEKDTRLAIDSIAAHEQVRFQTKNTKVFRQELDNGMKINICTQSLGKLVNGFVSKVMVIDCVLVGQACVKKGRHDTKSDIPTPPPVPTPEILEEITRNRHQKSKDIVIE